MKTEERLATQFNLNKITTKTRTMQKPVDISYANIRIPISAFVDIPKYDR